MLERFIESGCDQSNPVGSVNQWAIGGHSNPVGVVYHSDGDKFNTVGAVYHSDGDKLNPRWGGLSSPAVINLTLLERFVAPAVTTLTPSERCIKSGVGRPNPVGAVYQVGKPSESSLVCTTFPITQKTTFPSFQKSRRRVTRRQG